MSEGPSASSLAALLLLLLAPCLVLLLLLNCLFLLCRVLVGCRRGAAAEDLPLRSTLRSVTDVSFSPLLGWTRTSARASERVVTHPVTSSRASSLEARGAGRGMRLLPPDGGPGSQRAPSSIRAPSRASCRRAAPGQRPLPASRSDSEAEVRLNLVPPNSPSQESHRLTLTDASPDLTGQQLFLEHNSATSCSSRSAVGPGLDSDFGASAGVSLRILSADSDGLSSGLLASALEWDYYDPCYVRQNSVTRPQRQRPALHTRHYWV